MKQQLKLGQIGITPEADDQLRKDDVMQSLHRHARGDWGDLRREDRKQNEQALRRGGGVFSIYHDRNGTKFWIMTEADRSGTTVLLPDDYMPGRCATRPFLQD